MVNPKQAGHPERLVFGLRGGNRHGYARTMELFQQFPDPGVRNGLVCTVIRVSLPVMPQRQPGKDLIVSQVLAEGLKHGRPHQPDQVPGRWHSGPHGGKRPGGARRHACRRIQQRPVHVQQHAAEGSPLTLQRLLPKYHLCVLSFWSRADSCLLL